MTPMACIVLRWHDLTCIILMWLAWIDCNCSNKLFEQGHKWTKRHLPQLCIGAWPKRRTERRKENEADKTVFMDISAGARLQHADRFAELCGLDRSGGRIVYASGFGYHI